MTFSQFAVLVNNKFAKMQKTGKLFRVDSTKDQIWENYIGAFPEGSNPIFNERTEHDCNCCKSFLRRMGNVVSVKPNGELDTIWDVEADHPFDAVAKSLKDYVLSLPIKSVFVLPSDEVSNKGIVGTKENYNATTREKHYHFFAEMNGEFTQRRYDLDSYVGKQNESFEMAKRLVTTITKESLETILDLIASNSLYRGAEHKQSVKNALKFIKDFENNDKNLNLLWLQASNDFGVSRFRNTAIGTLADDLSKGEGLEGSVASFESKVAPSNYKRTTALITPKMTEDAKKKIQSLGLMDSLSRRMATKTDINANNVLFMNKTPVKRAMDVFDDLQNKTTKKTTASDYSKLESISLEKFIADILPRTNTLEILFDFGKVSRLVSLTTEAIPNSEPLFNWNNPFAWVYKGGVADSNIKELVKNAGGNIDADLRFSLAWHNNDDLDMSFVFDNSKHQKIYYSNRFSGGGELDIDMNGIGGMSKTRTPVENIFFKTIPTGLKGKVVVHNFSQRERIDTGYEVEVDILGSSMILKAKKPLNGGERATVGTISFKNGSYVFDYDKTLFDVVGGSSLEVWGIETGKFVPVSMVMKSPNHWEGEEGKGNEHVFFMVEGCKTDEKVRGFFNEYLKPELNQHRKVMEVLGDMTKVDPDSEQLSGLGFSTTTKEEIIVKVGGNINRTLKVILQQLT